MPAARRRSPSATAPRTTITASASHPITHHHRTMGLHRALAALLVLAVGAAASDFSEVAEIVASDGANGDKFGVSVASSGDFVVVGASADDDAGTSSGSAYVFRTTDGVTEQIAKLVSSDAAAQDQFGASVAIHNDIIVVGSIGNDNFKGASYIFKTSDDGATWPLVAKLVADDASDAASGDRFGYSVAIEGDTIAVGATLDNTGTHATGSAYVFKTPDGGATWTQKAKLVESNPTNGAWFGNSISLSGDVIAVGARYKNAGRGSQAGSAFVFRTTDGGETFHKSLPFRARRRPDDAPSVALPR